MDLSTQPVPAVALVYPEYKEDNEPSFEQICPVESLQRMIDANVWLGHPLDSDRVTEFLSWLRRIPAYVMRYNDLDQAVRWVMGRFRP